MKSIKDYMREMGEKRNPFSKEIKKAAKPKFIDPRSDWTGKQLPPPGSYLTPRGINERYPFIAKKATTKKTA